jgi:hypothetical protein
MAQRAEIRTPLPTSGRVHRVGKVRAGVKKQGSKNNKAFEYPSAVDYFVVNADAATSETSAQSFHDVYGPEPRELRITLPGELPEDVLETAWRLYGGGSVLKRKCQGPGGECKVRGAEGEWVYGPCKCTSEGRDPEDKSNHCQQRWTLSFLLMDVAGLGVWQFDTGSPMAGDSMASMLQLLHAFRGTLLRVECILRLVPVQVAPKGQAKTVYIARLESRDTPQAALDTAAGEPLGQLPPSTLDDGPDDLLDAVEIPQLVADAVARVPERETAPTMGGPAPSPETVLKYDPVTPLPVGAQLKLMSVHDRADLYRLAGIPKGSKTDVVRPLLCAAWDTCGLMPFEEEPVLATLLSSLKALEAVRGQMTAVEEFQRFADTGEDTSVGGQTTIGGEPYRDPS